MSNLFFTSDLHFRHKLMLTMRPFEDVEEMNESIIDNYNSIVGQKDTVWLLGDIGFGKFSEIETLVKRLKGHKHLILGNHDERYRKDYIKSGLFETVDYYKEIKTDKQRISLMHYPMYSWSASHYGAWQIHGHTHNNITEINKEAISKGLYRWDCGIDANNYFPISFDELKDKFKNETTEDKKE